MARNAVVDIDLGYNKIMQDLVRASGYSVLVGIQEGSKTIGKVKSGRKQPASENIAEYAAKNEFGTNEIPERSFMRTAVDENIPVITGAMSQQLGLVIDGNKTLRQAFDTVGILIGNLIQRKIRQITFPPNSQRTIAEKKSSKPLIDFGAMIAAVRHVVRRRGTTNP